MGFFSKVFKGIGKVFKKIGKGIKKVVAKVGKVVNKLGIVGQIGMMFIMPGIGGLLAKATSGLLGAVGTGIGATLARGVGHVLSYAGKFASTAGKMFKTVTSGIKNFVGKIGGEMLNKVGFKGFRTDGTISKAFGSWSDGVATDFKSSFDPFTMSNGDFIDKSLGKGKFDPKINDLDGMPAQEAESLLSTPDGNLDALPPKQTYKVGEFPGDPNNVAAAEVSTGINNSFIDTTKSQGTTNWFGDRKAEVVKSFQKNPLGFVQEVAGSFASPPDIDTTPNQVNPVMIGSHPLNFEGAVASSGYTISPYINNAQFVAANFADYQPSNYAEQLQARGVG